MVLNSRLFFFLLLEWSFGFEGFDTVSRAIKECLGCISCVQTTLVGSHSSLLYASLLFEI